MEPRERGLSLLKSKYTPSDIGLHVPVRVLLPIVMAFGGGMASLLMPLGYDEAFWLAIVGKVERGAGLYQGAIETKTPIVYLVIWVIDILPGSFELGRAMVLGGLAGLLAIAVLRLAPRNATATAGVVAATALLQAELHFTTELAALVLVFAVVAWSNRWPIALLATCFLGAVAFDPRTVVLLPGVALLIARNSKRSVARTFTLVCGLGVALGALTAFLHPDLRYALIELNLFSRGFRQGWFPSEQAAVMARSLLPPAVLVAVVRPRLAGIPAAVWLLLGGGGLIGLASVHAFDHYWAYPLLAVPFLMEPARENGDTVFRAADAVLVGIATLPLLINLAGAVAEQKEIITRYQAAGVILREGLDEGDTFVAFDIKPYLSALLPEHNALRAPTIHYLTMATSRGPGHRAEIPAILDDAEAIADDGGLSVPVTQLSPGHRSLSELFRGELDRFPCVFKVGDITLRFRIDTCPRNL